MDQDKSVLFVRLSNPVTLVNIIKFLARTCVDAIINFHNDGITCEYTSSDRAMCVNFEIFTEELLDYYCEKDISIGINSQSWKEMASILSHATELNFFVRKDNDSVDGHSRFIEGIIYRGEDDDERKTFFRVPSLILSEMDMEMMQLDFSPMRIISYEQFDEICKDAKALKGSSDNMADLTIHSRGKMIAVNIYRNGDASDTFLETRYDVSINTRNSKFKDPKKWWSAKIGVWNLELMKTLTTTENVIRLCYTEDYRSKFVIEFDEGQVTIILASPPDYYFDADE